MAEHYWTGDVKVVTRFLHQLILSIELQHRIQSPPYARGERRRILLGLPPKVAWSVALAQRWLENITLGKMEMAKKQRSYRFILRNKKRQVEILKNFAWTMKWPNMPEVEHVLAEEDSSRRPLEYRNPLSMSWFSGVILPGLSSSWLIMKALIDCDRDTEEQLDCLCPLNQNSGFQYRANTYWFWNCIVGKVMGAVRGVNQIAGWIGPCPYTPDLKRIQCVCVYQKWAEQRTSKRKLKSMMSRSHPMGPAVDFYPVEDYELVLPNLNDVVDSFGLRSSVSYQGYQQNLVALIPHLPITRQSNLQLTASLGPSVSATMSPSWRRLRANMGPTFFIMNIHTNP